MLWFVPLAAAQAPVSFVVPPTLDIGPGAAGFAVEDLDGDHHDDLVVLETPDTVNVLLATAHGAFVTTSHTIGGGVGSLAIEDLDGDGAPNVVVGNDDGANVLLNDGSGTFAAPLVSPVPFGLGRMVGGDFDGDGNVNLAGTRPDRLGRIAVLPGNGDGTFGALAGYPVGPRTSEVATGDVDDDGDLNLVVGDFRERVKLLLGNGNGTFQPATHVSPELASGLLLRDFNRDGNLNLALTTQPFDYRAVVHLGNGDGTFGPGLANRLLYPATDLVAADFDGDGEGDIATVQYPGFVSLLLGRGDGTFRRPSAYDTGDGGLALGVGDFGGDADPDLVIGGAERLTFLTGPSGTWRSKAPSVTAAVGEALAVADFDADGRLNLALTYGNPFLVGGGEQVSVVLGQGPAGVFGRPAAYRGGTDAAFVTAGNLDGDGFPDLAVSARDSVNVLLGVGDGTFAGRVEYPHGVANAHPKEVLTTDLDGDGALDLVLADGLLNVVSYLNNGDGTFGAAIVTGAGPDPTALATCDLDGDGNANVISAKRNGQHLDSVLLGNGDGTFQPNVVHVAAPVGSPIDVDCVDLDLDGAPDVVTVLYTINDSTVSVMAGNGDGTLQPPVTFPVGDEAEYGGVGDFNHDGFPDYLVSNQDNSGVDRGLVLLVGNGDLTFQPAVTWLPRTRPLQIGVADLDRDGWDDVVIPSSGGYATVLLNAGPQ